MTRASSGYVSDVSYSARFHPYLAPAWLNLVASLCAIDAPALDRKFTWCDLGCGPATTATLLAAAHPLGQFHGVDLLPEHIEAGNALKSAAAIKNVTLHRGSFDQTPRMHLPQFDYMVAHGVYSWVSPEVRADLRRCIKRHLKPGGLVYVSYNAMPGWSHSLPFQYMVYEAARRKTGDSITRFDGALKLIETLLDAGAQPLRQSLVGTPQWKARRKQLPAAYFPHEYLQPYWQPLYVSEVRRDMAEIGLEPVGSATVLNNFDSYCLQKRQRKVLGRIEDAGLRELARDYCMRASFRRDVFAMGGAPIDAQAQRERLLESTFDLGRPSALVKYSSVTPAGTLRFDHRRAHALVKVLEQGPQRLADVPHKAAQRRDLLATALTLCAAEHLIPLGPGPGPVGRLNRLIFEQQGTPDALGHLAHPFGAGTPIHPGLVKALRRERAPRGTADLWRSYLETRGMWLPRR